MTATVLCAVDINRPDAEAHVLRRAHELAVLDKAKLDVITVVPDFGASIVGLYLEDHHVKTAKDGASEALHTFVSDVLSQEVDKDVRHIVATGSVYEEVLKAAKISGADLIVIGAHSPDFKDYLLGPNASRVVRHSDCSVYVVR